MEADEKFLCTSAGSVLPQEVCFSFKKRPPAPAGAPFASLRNLDPHSRTHSHEGASDGGAFVTDVAVIVDVGGVLGGIADVAQPVATGAVVDILRDAAADGIGGGLCLSGFLIGKIGL